MTATLAVSGSVLVKAGANVSSNFTSTNADTNIDPLINQAESLISSISRKDWVAAYSTLTDEVKKILEQFVSAVAAMACISYDMSGYSSRREAETMLDVLNNESNRAQSLLMNQQGVKFIESDT